MNTNTNMIQFNNCEEEVEGYFFVDDKKIEITTVPLADMQEWLSDSTNSCNNFHLRENSLYRLLKYYDIHKIDVTVTDPIFIRVFSNHPVAKNCFRIYFEDYIEFQKKYFKSSLNQNWNKEGF